MLARRLLPLLAAFGISAAHAGVLNLTAPIGGANVYAIHDFSANSSDVEGAVIAGGNVTLSGYSVNALNRDAFGDKNYAVVAGGRLSLSNGSINNGLSYAGGAVKTSSAGPLQSTSVNPVDFRAAETYYKSLAASLAQLDASGTVSRLWSGVKVSGSGKGGVDIFDVSAELLRTSSSWTLENLVPGETLIFNVSGKSGSFNGGGISFQPLAGYNVLFNFYEATEINAKGLIGSLLAPYATMSDNWGVINGNVIVDTWSSTVQINANHYFVPVEVAGLKLDKGSAQPQHGEVPEPGSAALVLAGLAAAGLARARLRRNT